MIIWNSPVFVSQLTINTIIVVPSLLQTPALSRGRDSRSLVASAHRFVPSIIPTYTPLLCCSLKKCRKVKENALEQFLVVLKKVAECDSQFGPGHLTLLQRSSAPLSVNVTVRLAKGLLSAGWRQLFVCSLKRRTLSVCPEKTLRAQIVTFCLFFRRTDAEYNLSSVHNGVSSCPSWQCCCYMRIFLSQSWIIIRAIHSTACDFFTLSLLLWRLHFIFWFLN